MLVGWGLFFVTHFLASVNVTIQVFKRLDTSVSAVILYCFVLVLTSLFFIGMSLIKLKEKSTPTQGSTKLNLSRELRYQLNRFYELVVADICLIYIVLFTFKARFPYMFPIYVDRINEYGKAELKMVHLNNYMFIFDKVYTDFFYTYLGKYAKYILNSLVYILYGLTWVVGGAQLAALGISGYLVYLSNDLYKTVFSLV